MILNVCRVILNVVCREMILNVVCREMILNVVCRVILNDVCYVDTKRLLC